MKHTYLSTSLFILTSIFTIHYSSAAPAVEQRTTEGSASSRTTEGSASSRTTEGSANSTPPNIIFILADDWGLGDVKTYGGDRCKIDTPHMDRLAETGMKFTDAHSSSAVCTPTRYSVLTGRYNWRSRLKQMVLWGFSPPLIEPGRETVASMLKQNGYTTCMLGKWHLGMNMPTTDGKAPAKTGKNTDWKAKIKNGPNAVGFDYYYGISASLDMPPYIWIENERFVGECTTEKKFLRKGVAHADFEAVDVLPVITEKAVAYVTEQAKTKQPFFLYMPLASPHTPIVPSKNFQGKSPLGAYGDFVMETDWAVGEVVKAVEAAGIAKNTLIIVTADNGCSNAARPGFKDQSQLMFRTGGNAPDEAGKHYASDIYRGHKADIYEGGHRVPFIARWDGQVKAGSISDDTVCLVDLFATCADIVGAEVADTAAEDSVSILPVLNGTTQGPIREAVVHHSINGSFAIRKGKWKLAFCPGSGGWTHPRPGKPAELKKLEAHEWVQLFDMQADPAETKNLSAQHPDKVKELTQLAEKTINDGRSTPGAKQQNDGAKTELYPGWIREAKN
jgi:arylsulfatase A